MHIKLMVLLVTLVFALGSFVSIAEDEMLMTECEPFEEVVREFEENPPVVDIDAAPDIPEFEENALPVDMDAVPDILESEENPPVVDIDATLDVPEGMATENEYVNGPLVYVFRPQKGEIVCSSYTYSEWHEKETDILKDKIYYYEPFIASGSKWYFLIGADDWAVDDKGNWIKFPLHKYAVGDDGSTWLNIQPTLIKYNGPVTDHAIPASELSDYCFSLHFPDGPTLSFKSGIYTDGINELDLRLKGIGGGSGSAFAHLEGLEAVTIPDTIEWIGHDAFTGCTSLTTVNLPTTLTEIGSAAFSGCTSLTTVNLPTTLTEIGSAAFSGCTSLRHVTIPEGITDIFTSLFSGCTSLESVTLPKTMADGGFFPNAFDGCTSLKHIDIPEGISSLGDHAFLNCTALESITFNTSTLRQIEEYAFEGCTSLKQVMLPSTVKEIYEGAFYRCTSLSEIVLPEALERLGDVHIAHTPQEKYKGVFQECASLKAITVPKGLRFIGDFTFMGCTSLKSTDLASIEVVGISAFRNCTRLASVTFGSCVELDENAFRDCSALKKVVFEDGAIRIPDSVFKGCPKLNFVISPYQGYNEERYALDHDIPYTYTDGTLPEPASIAIANGKSASLNIGEKLKLKITTKPVKCQTTLTWTTSDNRVATVTAKGVVQGISKGTATITVETSNLEKAEIKIKVTTPKVASVTIANGRNKALKVGEKLTLKAVLKPNGAVSKLIWTSSNVEVAAVSAKGVVTAKKVGEATITVRTTNKKTAKIKITVKK